MSYGSTVVSDEYSYSAVETVKDKLDNAKGLGCGSLGHYRHGTTHTVLISIQLTRGARLVFLEAYRHVDYSDPDDQTWDAAPLNCKAADAGSN